MVLEFPSGQHGSVNPCGKTPSPPPTLGSRERDKPAQLQGSGSVGSHFVGELREGEDVT